MPEHYSSLALSLPVLVTFNQLEVSSGPSSSSTVTHTNTLSGNLNGTQLGSDPSPVPPSRKFPSLLTSSHSPSSHHFSLSMLQLRPPAQVIPPLSKDSFLHFCQFSWTYTRHRHPLWLARPYPLTWKASSTHWEAQPRECTGGGSKKNWPPPNNISSPVLSASLLVFCWAMWGRSVLYLEVTLNGAESSGPIGNGSHCLYSLISGLVRSLSLSTFLISLIS